MADDAREIENLIYTYAERIDAGDFAGVGDLFARGRIALAANAAPEQVFEGRERVASLYRRTTRLYADGTPHTKHVTTNAIIEVADDRAAAAARSAYTVLQQIDEQPLQPIIAGHYHDTFHCVEGRWWFDTRIIGVDLVGDLSRHLLIEIG